MTTPKYLETFRRAVREIEAREKSELSEKSLTLISHISLFSQPKTLESITATAIAGNEIEEKRQPVAKPLACEKSEISEKRGEVFPYAKALNALERRIPEYIEPDRWQQCLVDAKHFLLTWGDQAEALGWTVEELFGLHTPPANPHPSYSRLTRYDCTGLIWHLQGHRVVALTADTAAIQSRATRNILIYRKARSLHSGQWVIASMILSSELCCAVRSG
jgi:hypothetical protein